MWEKGGASLSRPNAGWIVVIVILALVRTWTAVPGWSDAPESYKHAPYPLRTVGGGNCVWFAWQMAWQKWGLILPVMGHAKQWTLLDGVCLQQRGRIAKLAVTDTPQPDSIMILPSRRQSYHGLIPAYGHLAWVKEVYPHKIVVWESTIFPRQPGQQWQGCWYQQFQYPTSALSKARYLYLEEVRPVDNQVPGTPLYKAPIISRLAPMINSQVWQSCRDMWAYTVLNIRLLTSSKEAM